MARTKRAQVGTETESSQKPKREKTSLKSCRDIGEIREPGRPTKYRPSFNDLAFNLALLGAGRKEFADTFGVEESTVELWKQEFPEFSDAIKAGGAKADALVTKRLFQRAIGYSHKSVKIFYNSKTGEIVQVPFIEHFEPDVAAQRLWLNSRRRNRPSIDPDSLKWVDSQQVEMTGPNGTPLINKNDLVEIDPKTMSTAEIEALIASHTAAGNE